MNDKIYIKKIKFFAGKNQNSSPLDISVGRVVVFVGPNNSGKSLSLREIEDWSTIGSDSPRKIIQDIEMNYTKRGIEIEKIYKFFSSKPPGGQVLSPSQKYIVHHSFKQGQSVRNITIDVQAVKDAVTASNISFLRDNLFSLFTVRLDGRTRFVLTDPKQSGDLQIAPQNHLWSLFTNDVVRAKVRKLIYDALNYYFVIDLTGLSQFRIRLSLKPPPSDVVERGTHGESLKFHSQAPEIKEYSDGVQAFVGLISAVMSIPDKIILIDEPEAFLHPPLARRLGSYLSKISNDRNASLLVSTHSAEFLMGCLETEENTSVVRLTYSRNIPTARVLPAVDLENLINDPLLRSTGVYRALFHSSVVISEADADRAFYDEINRRLVNKGKGIVDSLFISPQTKDTIGRMIKPLREIGIPAAAIIDLDLLVDVPTKWKKIMDACQISGVDRTFVDSEKLYFKSIFDGIGKDTYKKRGINALDLADRTRVRLLLKKLNEYGLFIVYKGELECWLQNVGGRGHGPDWLISIFSKIGKKETDTNYLFPATGDVWGFLNSIAKWVSDPHRLGVS
ncbi:MAG TPA: AAA family ATPase [Patescibacteria group bacterium]|nr:AAA family ATPase [Patescibacteria group bacterium]